MRSPLFLLLALGSSCAANAEHVPAERQPMEHEVAARESSSAETTVEAAPPQVPKSTGHATPALRPEPIATDEPPWRCQVQTDTPEIRKHLGLDDMGPTGSQVRLPVEPGFVRFDGDGEVYYAGYICETWSADSDECDGSVVQVAELAAVSGTSTEVIWRSEPKLGSGGWCGSKEPSGTFRDLAVDDFDGDGQPDLRFSSTNPARSTVRLFDGTRYEAWLPKSATTNPEFDLCRPTTALLYSVQKGDDSKAVSTNEIPPRIKAALATAYLPSAECPDAQ